MAINKVTFRISYSSFRKYPFERVTIPSYNSAESAAMLFYISPSSIAKRRVCPCQLRVSGGLIVFGKMNIINKKGETAMAVPTSIKTLLSGNVVEWARVEFKETWDA